MRKVTHSSNVVKSRKPSQVRIVGGSLRGRKINFVDGEGVRPTLDRIRETLFNWLTADIAGAICLDLFAGSGALGIEAVSRGAKSVILVDTSKQVTDSLAQNLSDLKINNIQIINQSAEKYLLENKLKFDIIFLDPPFGKGMLTNVLQQLQAHLSPKGLVYIEQENSDSTLKLDEEWQLIKSKKTSRFYYELVSLS